MRACCYLLLLAIGLTGCSGITISGVDKADNFQISNYKTFDFYQIEVSGDVVSANSKQNLELLKSAIKKELQAKGLTQTASDPNLLVNIGVVVVEKVQTRESRLGEDPTYMGPRNYSWERHEIEVGRYREGTVTVHLVEREAKKLVWKGAAEGVLPSKDTNVPATIEVAMKELFAKLN